MSETNPISGVSISPQLRQASQARLERVQQVLGERARPVEGMTPERISAQRSYYGLIGEGIQAARSGHAFPRLPPSETFPRSGWADRGALWRELERTREALLREETHWRLRFVPRRGPTPPTPELRMMYGMPYPRPPSDMEPPPGHPGPPDIMPMYGMPNPPHDEDPCHPVPPPNVMPMYGMPYPPREPPVAMPMYGMPFPPDRPWEPVSPPELRMMYGMPEGRERGFSP